MSLVVETGAGVTGANSFVALTYASAYLTQRGLTVEGGDTALEQQLILAADQLSTLEFSGRKQSTENDLPFPRIGCYGKDRALVEESTVPAALMNAQVWLAHYAASGSDLGSVATAAVKREKADILEQEFAVVDGHKVTTRIQDLPNAFNLVRPYLRKGGGNNSGRLIRA